MMRKIFLLLFFVGSLLFADPWGEDANIVNYPYQKLPTEKTKKSVLSDVMKNIIRFHQRVISPVDGPRSHFIPSSSQYMFNAIRKYGFFKGYVLGCDRLLRENNDPWFYPTIPAGDVCVKYDPVR